MTEPDHEAKARDFVDSILEVNRKHGVHTEPAEIEYHEAVDAALDTFKYLREDTTESDTTEPA